MADPVRDHADDDADETQQKAALTVSSAKAFHPASKEYRAATNTPVCGDFGGERGDGTPCTLIAGAGTVNAKHRTGRCYLHCDEKLEEEAEAKKKFIKEFMEQPMTVRLASQKAGVNYMTILRYRKKDPDFDAEVRAILDVVTEARAQFIEDSATLRAMDPNNNADTLRIFMLKNLMGHKYKDSYAAEHSGPHGGPIPVVQHNVRWNVDGDSVRFFGQTAPREEIPLPPPLEDGA